VRCQTETPAPGTGVYHVEAHFTPNDLRSLFKNKRIAGQNVKEFVWIYSSAIRIR